MQRRLVIHGTFRHFTLTFVKAIKKVNFTAIHVFHFETGGWKKNKVNRK